MNSTSSLDSSNFNENDKELCLHQLFEIHARRSPESIALTCDGQNLTYAQLNSRANQLARRLHVLGVKAECPVAIYMERSIEMIVAILAVLKSGGAYVPLDLSHPKERLSFILKDTQSLILLTQEALLKTLPPYSGTVICLDGDHDLINSYEISDLSKKASSKQLAYVIYTSGSTGKPKGVLINHHHVARLFTQTENWFHFDSTDVWTMFHSYAFDFSVWEIWGPLINGGRLVIVPYFISRSPELFCQLLCQERVSVLNQTPSAFQQLMRVEERFTSSDPCLNLKFVIFGGEALNFNTLMPWLHRHGDEKPRLINMYGITETTVHATYHRITLNDLNSASNCIIGVPIPDLQIYVLDDQLQKVDTGKIGEIYVAGEGVARGYLNRPELTAERFIPNPFAASASKRLYRSGDLARCLPNGTLEYLGRKDQQVKIRGYRIELGEIETVLMKHPFIQEVMVLAETGSEAGDARLTAYIVPKSSDLSSLSRDVRNFLKQQLPAYMIPSYFEFIDSLPLTPNGKLDRRALPHTRNQRPELENQLVPPTTETEQILSNIWMEVLHIKNIGIHDSFFDLGGDSIRSIQLLARCAQKGLSVNIQQLFELQTIHRIANQIDKTPTTTHSLEAKLEPFSLISEQDKQKLPEDLEDAYPLARLQNGMLFHSELNPDSPVYHDVFTYDVQTDFDFDRFRSAIDQLTICHPILRTSFDQHNYTQPLQLVHKKAEVPLELKDLRPFSDTEQNASIVEWIECEKFNSFDWHKAPLLRIAIFRCSEQSFQIAVSFHHVILDGWSLAAMVITLLEEYSRQLSGETRVKETSFPHYRNFIALERKAVQDSDSKRFWKEYLKDFAFVQLPRWPTSYRSDSNQIGVVHKTCIPSSLFQNIKKLAKHVGIPLKSVLLTAHHRVMSLMSGQTDIVTGLVSNGRPEELNGEKTLGLFLNTLPFRVKLNGGTWLELLRETFDHENQLLPFRRYPMADIYQELGSKPLFEAVFDFVHFHVYNSSASLGRFELVEGTYFEANNFPLLTVFSLDVHSSQLDLILNYDAREFCQEQIQAIAGYYLQCLRLMTEDPEQRYENAILIPKEEQNQLLIEWNDTAKEYSRSLFVHRQMELNAEKNPYHIAAVFEQQQLTYLEINQQANQLAHYLSSLGLGKGDFVAICMDRTLETIWSLMGILKSGAAYIPLDPAYPKARIQWILSFLNVPCIVTQSSYLPIIFEIQQHLKTLKHVVCLDETVSSPAIHSELIENRMNPKDVCFLSHLRRLPTTNLITPLNLEDTAYVIFTSGSTGTPKGVEIKHRSLCNLVDWVNTRFQVESSDRLLFVTSLCFDLSVYDIFGVLSAGGSIHIASSKDLRDPERLLDLLHTEPITFWDSAPAVLQQLVPFLKLAKYAKKNTHLRLAFLSGDWIPVELPDLIRARFPKCQFIALGGATEATIWSNYYPVQKVDPRWVSIPYGKPIQNSQYYILDRYLNPVPKGVIGDLYIGGDCLAAGYIHQPEMTAKAFIDNPFQTKSAKIYRTGDLARYLADGNIEFLGRNDLQVKIRGFRIELGEIESALKEYPAIRDAVVIACADRRGDKRLLAYYTTATVQTLSSQILRQFLSNKLPDYMIPYHFQRLDILPMTPHGKVDRAALSNDPSQLNTPQSHFTPPQNAVEEMIATVWSDLLKVKKIGLHDNFFELGGHSLLATQLVLRLREIFKIEISLRGLFESPTVAGLSSLMLNNPQSRNKVERTAQLAHRINNMTDTQMDSLFTPPIKQQRRKVSSIS
jgi:amino acid adenylation domain-containing protein